MTDLRHGQVCQPILDELASAANLSEIDDEARPQGDETADGTQRRAGDEAAGVWPAGGNQETAGGTPAASVGRCAEARAKDL